MMSASTCRAPAQALASCSSRARPTLAQRPASRRQDQNTSYRCAASSVDIKEVVYPGMFGDWSIDDADIAEVNGYRVGISVAAVSAALVTLTMLLDRDHVVPASALNALCVTGALGFGVSVFLIHIYVTEIKRTIQALFGFGCVSGLWLMGTNDGTALPVFVVEQAWSLWLVGPAFAAITAVAIKEGLCYGKGEAAALALVTPLWLLGHLTGIIPREAESVLAVLFTSIFAFFAARKYSQAIHSDVGDKSVFTFRALPEAEQQRVLQELEAAKQQ